MPKVSANADGYLLTHMRNCAEIEGWQMSYSIYKEDRNEKSSFCNDNRLE